MRHGPTFLKLFIPAFLAIIVIIAIVNRNEQSISAVKVFLVGVPFSSDPLDYDAFVHHVAFRSVYSSIVTEYRSGSIEGVLADSWKHSENYTEWTFSIRPGMRFANGSQISSAAIVNSWMRLAFIMKVRGSKSEVFDFLIGREKISSPRSSISGLTYDERNIYLKFTKPLKNLLTALSFGLYAVVDESDYDALTGAWKDKRKLNASGPYEIEFWDDSRLAIRKRNDYGLKVGHPKQFDKINFFWDVTRVRDADLIMGNSNETELNPEYTFYGGANSSIAYARCRPWQINGNICSDLQSRLILRDAFYKSFEADGSKVTRSFFPLAIKGVKELENSRLETFPAHSFGEKIRFYKAKSPNIVFQKFNRSVRSAIESLGSKAEEVSAPYETFVAEYDQGLKSYSADIYMLATAILIDDPMQDVRFMFLSKEGIRLPDSDGSIHKELEKNYPNLQRVNELLWKQGIVWPVTHYASGLWAKSGIDFSMMNLIIPPADFQWLGSSE
jgi:hypothetical protein